MKNEFLIMLVESNVNLILLFALYYLVKNRLKIGLRRFLLLSLPVLAIIPSIASRIDWISKTQINLPLVNLNTLTLNGKTIEDSTSVVASFDYVYWFYIFGLVFLLARYVYAYFRTIRLISKATLISKDKVSIYEDSELRSFSFLNKIVLNAELDKEAKEMVLKHEQIHVEKKHSLDKLWLSSIHTICWFNPFFILMNRELDDVQEYQVDSYLYQEYETNYTDFILSHVFGVSSFRNHLSNQFGLTSNLKNRIIMMTKKAKKGWIAMLLFPAVIVSMSMISWKASAQDKTPQVTNTPKGDEPYTYVEKMPEFPGGQEKMIAFINENIKYPDTTSGGTVYVGFVVTKTGELKEVKTARGFKESFDNECVRVVKSMPNWIPGEEKHKKVDVKFILPIRFVQQSAK